MISKVQSIEDGIVQLSFTWIVLSRRWPTSAHMLVYDQ